MRRVYFDNAATTKVHPKVFEKMLPFLKEDYGNPSSIHSYGRKVRVEIEEAREVIADFINADASEIYFLSSGTEANNFSLFGIAKTEFQDSKKNSIITTKAEHHCIIDACKELLNLGFEVNFADVKNDTTVNPSTIEKSISDKTSLISVIHINNETGAINDISNISEICKKHNVYFHSDVVQSFGKTKIDVKKIGVNSISASAHKINGPKGIGMVYAKSGIPLSPMIFGGSQERNRRAGTENAAGIIGFAEAVKIATKTMYDNETFVKNIKEKFASGIEEIDKENIDINGGVNSSPYIFNVTFNSNVYKNDAEAMLMFLDINGIAASNGAACTSGTLKPSHVILSSGKSEEDANGSIRFSFSYENTLEEVDYVLDVLKKMTKKFRK